jgi:hypothetical protein
MPNRAKISGPVSMHTFHLPTHGHEVIIFGDVHFSYDNLCPQPCQKPECETITAFFQRYVASAKDSGRSLDVYVELPYVHRSNPLKQRQVDGVEKAVSENVLDLSERNKKRKRKRMMSIGILGHLFRVFGKHLYDDNTKVIGDAANVRFHYADARYEQNMVRLIPADVDRLVARLDGDGSRIVRVLAAMIFGSAFGPSLSLEDQAMVFPESLSTWRGRKVHKVAKQFMKLPQSTLKDRLKLYLEMRVHRVVPWVRQLKKDSESLVVYIRSVIMDAYLLSRMLYYALLKRAVGGASIVYVGHAHAMEFVSFLKEYAHLPPELCDVGRDSMGRTLKDSTPVDDAKRCIRPVRCKPTHKVNTTTM